MTLSGADISHHQETTPDLAPFDFVFVRAAYGNKVDGMYEAHASAVRAAGLVLGAYLFARPPEVSLSGPIEDQIAVFLETAGAVPPDIIAIDRENETPHGTITKADTREMIRLLHEQGRRVGLYSPQGQFQQLGQDFDWVARWGNEPTIPFDVWQFRGAPLDLNTFRGTRGALLALGAPLREWVEQQDADQLETIATLAGINSVLRADLAAAPGIERERIAQAEAERLRNT